MKPALTVFAMSSIFALPAFGSEMAERLAPSEILTITPGENGPGTSGAAGMQTRILSGDPAKPGLYAIQITIPPHTIIKAHTHRDNRVATVVSGLWLIGYGDQRSETALKALSAGSFYTEPAGMTHFAGTKDLAAVVVITGFGPTDTRYVDIADKPKH